MHFELRTLNTDMAEALRGYVERRLRFALRHFENRVGFVSVVIVRKNRTESSCRISAQVPPFGLVHIRESDSDLFTAINRATGAIGHLVGRELERLARHETQENRSDWLRSIITRRIDSSILPHADQCVSRCVQAAC
jgi:ribosomal subunit interface protein